MKCDLLTEKIFFELQDKIKLAFCSNHYVKKFSDIFCIYWIETRNKKMLKSIKSFEQIFSFADKRNIFLFIYKFSAVVRVQVNPSFPYPPPLKWSQIRVRSNTRS